MKKLVTITVGLLILSCNQINENKEEVKTRVNSDNSYQTKTIQGKVCKIQNGKDGYRAKIKTENNELYFVTISSINLKDSNDFKYVQIGESITITGDYWITENEKQITARILN